MPPEIPSTPPPEPELELTYQTPERVGNAPKLVRLAAIFNIVSACLDLVYVTVTIAIGVGIYYMATAIAPLAAPGGGAPPPSSLSAGFLLGSFILPGSLSFVVMIPKMIGGIQLLRLGRGAWGWGLTAGICGAVQVWTYQPCCFPLFVFMGLGISTIVMMCLPHVRSFLAPGNIGDGWQR